MIETIYTVTGTTCGHCAQSVTGEIGKISGACRRWWWICRQAPCRVESSPTRCVELGKSTRLCVRSEIRSAPNVSRGIHDETGTNPTTRLAPTRQ
jgi:copper chaperone CopZ